MCFLTWFACGFIFVQIPVLSNEIKTHFFPANDSSVSILMISAIFSLTLLSRFFGSLIISSKANRDGIRIVIISLVLLLLVTILQYCVVVIFDFNYQLTVTFVFIFARLFIGFFVGGIWPTMAIFSLEEYFRKKSPTNLSNKDHQFRRRSQDYSIKSAFIQNGFTFSLLVEGIIAIFLFNSNYHIEGFNNQYVIPLLQYLNIGSTNVELPAFQVTSVIGIFSLLIVIIYWLFYLYRPKRSSENSNSNNKRNNNQLHLEFYRSDTVNSKSASLRDLLVIKKYRNTLIRLWLILSGLMYMFYSTVVITPDLIYRQNPEFSFPIVLILVWISSVIGHSILGFFYPGKILRLINFFKNHLISYKSVDVTDNKDDEKQNNNDILSILICSIIIIFLAFTFLLVLYFAPNFFKSGALYIQLFLIFFANIGWAIVHTLISNRFPSHFRYLAAGLVYNGGLIISFASPFVLQEMVISGILTGPYIYYIVIIPMFLGGISMFYGSFNLWRDFLTRRLNPIENIGYAEILLPSRWTSSISSKDEDTVGKYSVATISNSNNPPSCPIWIYYFDRKLLEITGSTSTKNLRNFFTFFRRQIDTDNFGHSYSRVIEKDPENTQINSYKGYKVTYYGKNNELNAVVIFFCGHFYGIIYEYGIDDKLNKLIDSIVETFDIKLPLQYENG